MSSFYPASYTTLYLTLWSLGKTPLSIFYQNEEHRDENLEFWRETGWTFTWEKKRYHFKVEKSLRQIGSLKITKPPMGDLKKAFPIPDKPLAFFGASR